MKQATLEIVRGRDLPTGWAERLGVRPDELVKITIEPIAAAPTGRRFDRKAIELILDEVAALPVLDDRTPEEILGQCPTIDGSNEGRSHRMQNGLA